MAPKQLEGKTAIVTGAGVGIGRSMGLAFAEEGANIVVVSRTLSDIEQVATEASYFRVGSLAIRVDVSIEEQVEEMVKRTLDAFGRIDILVNNAGVPGPTGFLTDLRAKDWDQTFNTNLKGVFLCSKAVLPQMIKQKGGNIINISSGAGKRTKEASFTSPTRSLAYSVSKFGVEGFTLALAGQVNKYRINVNALRPGPTNTRFHAETSPEKRAKMRHPDDLRKVAVFLASQGPLGLTGESIDALTWERTYLNREV